MIVALKPLRPSRAKLASRWGLITAILATGGLLTSSDPSIAAAQIRYPATQYRGYTGPVSNQEAFSVSPPLQNDSPQVYGANDYRSMSPDSWENPQTGFQPSDNPFPQSSGSTRDGSAVPARRPAASPTPRANPLASSPAPPQAPRNDQYFQPNTTPQPPQAQGQFRPASHPLNAQAPELSGDSNQFDEMLLASPAVPEDIRLPDLLPPSVFSVKGNSVMESGPTTPTSGAAQQDTAPDLVPGAAPQFAPTQQAPPATNNQGYAFGPDDLQLDPARLPGSTQNLHPHLSPSQTPNQDPQNLHFRTGEPVPAAGTGPIRRRRPELTPSLAQPSATAPPAESPNRMTVDQFYQGQQSFGYPADVAVPPGTAWPLTPPNYRPDLGHRQPTALTRATDTNDYGQEFDFEKKHAEYPKLGEILSTGRYFGSATMQYLRPSFQANTSLFLNQSGATETFDFAYKLAPKIQLGFESKFGPGIELEYWGFSDFSRVSSFTSDGIETGTTSAWMRGANLWSRLSAVNAGETLTSRHRMELDVLGASFFKEVKLPKARINGKFGFQTAHIIHELVSELSDSSGAGIGSLRSRSDVRGFGPQFELEYFRPIGHTKIEFLTSASGSVLFGKQSQVIANSTGGNQSRLKADEFIMTFDFFSGAQYRLMFGENRYWFARAGMMYQAWLHGGTAVLPQDDFGLRGFTITAGVNR